MQDIPQPADDSYSVGDRVQVYIDSDDPDSRYHGIICEVVSVLTDDLDTETGRITDAYSYSVQSVESGEELPVSFRHRDLVPAENNQ